MRNEINHDFLSLRSHNLTLSTFFIPNPTELWDVKQLKTWNTENASKSFQTCCQSSCQFWKNKVVQVPVNKASSGMSRLLPMEITKSSGLCHSPGSLGCFQAGCSWQESRRFTGNPWQTEDKVENGEAVQLGKIDRMKRLQEEESLINMKKIKTLRWKDMKEDELAKVPTTCTITILIGFNCPD